MRTPCEGSSMLRQVQGSMLWDSRAIRRSVSIMRKQTTVQEWLPISLQKHCGFN